MIQGGYVLLDLGNIYTLEELTEEMREKLIIACKSKKPILVNWNGAVGFAKYSVGEELTSGDWFNFVFNTKLEQIGANGNLEISYEEGREPKWILHYDEL